VLDEGEGFAFIRQIEVEGEEQVPRLIRKRALSYHATVLLVCLREELVRFDSRADDAARLVKSRAELCTHKGALRNPETLRFSLPAEAFR
jgi:hypothetical protein